MQAQRLRVVLCALSLLLLSSIAASAQTSLGLSAYGAFNGTTNGNGTVQSPANQAGGLIELRHISNPILGFEATYSFNRANQRYTFCDPNTNVCNTTSVAANAHEITGDYVASVHVANFRPFALVGVGVLFDQPDSNQMNTVGNTTGVYVYGGGLDVGLLPHLGLRFQYRGNLYKAPDISRLYTSTDRFTHTAEPMIGAYISF